MKIRAEFVSNSSSTWFLIISKGAFTSEQLQRLGVGPDSPMRELIDQLYSELMDGVNQQIELENINGKAHWKYLMGSRADRLTDRMIEQLDAYRKEGWTAYYGSLDSESNPVQTFFCMDSFEEENDEVYLNGLECAW